MAEPSLTAGIEATTDVLEPENVALALNLSLLWNVPGNQAIKGAEAATARARAENETAKAEAIKTAAALKALDEEILERGKLLRLTEAGLVAAERLYRARNEATNAKANLARAMVERARLGGAFVKALKGAFR